MSSTLFLSEVFGSVGGGVFIGSLTTGIISTSFKFAPSPDFSSPEIYVSLTARAAVVSPSQIIFLSMST